MSGVRLSLARFGGGKPAGFSLARTVADEAELLLLAVVPDARRCGVGSTLVEGFVADSRKSNAHRLHLEVRDGNRAAELYRRHGFEVVGRRSKYYKSADGEFFDALTMARPVTID